MSGIVTTDGRAIRSRGQRTRARLLEAATEVFAARGFHAARVDDIVAAAETSHGTFYVYFASKESLFDELIAEVGGEMAELVDELPAFGGDASDQAVLRAWLERFAEFYDRSGAVLQAWTEVESAAEPAGMSGTDLLDHMTRAVGPQVAVPAPAPRRDDHAVPIDPTIDPMIAALALMAMIERFHHYASTGQLRATRDEVLDTLVEVLSATATP